MKVTKREVIAGIIIIAVMMIIGLFISDHITDWQHDKNAVYQKAVQIDNNTDMFQYGMDTNVGNAFVYGDLLTVDTVTYEEIGGEYMFVEKVKEKYTMHTQTYTVKVGKTYQTRTRTYWSWDRVDSENKMCKQITFCGITFDSNKIKQLPTHLIDTIKGSSRIRYRYYGVDTHHVGTIFAELSSGTIPDNTEFYENQKIEEVLNSKIHDGWNVIFWVIWIILMCGVTIGFYYLDNRWLNS